MVFFYISKLLFQAFLWFEGDLTKLYGGYYDCLHGDWAPALVHDAKYN